ncbi:MAG: glycosyltransferase family 2 protein [Planctomycetes bacterium]|nr:glycosyltransferase family 2 protein [Planctomycetota bacterium]
MSVVIPCLNPSPDELTRAVASARRTPGVAETIVVDDGSEPPVSHDAADVLVRLEANAGPSAARNAGVAHARREFVLFLDCDDELLADGVTALRDLMGKLGAIAGVAGRQIDERGRLSLKPPPETWSGRALAAPGEVFRPIEMFSASGLLVARRAFEQGARFDHDLFIGEDRDFIRRIADLGPIAVSSSPIVRMHRDGASLTSSAHLSRRVRDHLVLLDRWCDAGSEANFREATRWLINACSKASVADETWRTLLAAARSRGWGVAFKPRVRRTLRGRGALRIRA